MEAVRGASLTMHYTGWVYENGKRGKQFDSSVGGAPFTFRLGAGEVIEGWDEGIAGMKVGGKRELILPLRARITEQTHRQFNAMQLGVFQLDPYFVAGQDVGHAHLEHVGPLLL